MLNSDDVKNITKIASILCRGRIDVDADDIAGEAILLACTSGLDTSDRHALYTLVRQTYCRVRNRLTRQRKLLHENAGLVNQTNSKRIVGPMEQAEIASALWKSGCVAIEVSEISTRHKYRRLNALRQFLVEEYNFSGKCDTIDTCRVQ